MDMALRFCEPSIPALLRRLSGRELIKWFVYDSINPIGMEREDLRTGHITAAICQALGSKRKPTDFVLCKKPERTETVEEFHERMEAMVRFMGGVVIDPADNDGG